jgi:hypothetical protein
MGGIEDLQQLVGVLPPSVISELLAKIVDTLAAPPANLAPDPGDQSD